MNYSEKCTFGGSERQPLNTDDLKDKSDYISITVGNNDNCKTQSWIFVVAAAAGYGMKT